MAIRADGICFIVPDNTSFHVPEKPSAGKGETNSRAKEYFLKHNSFHKLENSLFWNVQFSEDFGLTKLLTDNSNNNLIVFF